LTFIGCHVIVFHEVLRSNYSIIIVWKSAYYVDSCEKIVKYYFMVVEFFAYKTS